MASYSKIIDTIDNAAANYAAAVTEQEKQLFDEAVNLTHALETTSTGKIKCSLANINRLAKIKAALAKVAQSHPYLKAVAKLAKQMGNIQELQLEYYHKAFPEKAMSESALEQAEAVKQIAVKYTIDGLTGAGIEANVLDGINKMLLKAVTTSESYAALTKELQKTLISTPGSASAFAKYANTYATTAMTQYAGQQNKLFTEDLGVHWFRYVGSTIETTRPICELLTAKEYIHISEIPGILEGKVDVGGEIKTVPIYEKTGLPYGMIEGTTKDNFQVNVGGWNCRHQLVPVADAAVPQNLRDKFDEEAKAKAEAAAKAKAAAEAKAKAEAEKKAKEEAEKKAAEEAAAKAKAEAEAKAKAEAEKKAKEDAYKQFISDSKKYKDFDEAAAQKALQDGDYASLDKIKMEMFDLQQQLQALSQLAAPEADAKLFSYDELAAVNKAIDNTLTQWLTKHGYKTLEDNLEHSINKMQFEIDQVKKSKKYATWEIAANAYQKKLDELNAMQLAKQLASLVPKYKSFKTKSKVYAQHLSDLQSAIAAKDYTKITLLTNQLDDLQKKLAKVTPTQKLFKEVQKHKVKSTNSDTQSRHLVDSHMTGQEALDIIKQMTGVSSNAEAKALYEAVFGFSWQWDFEIRAMQCGTNFTSRHAHSYEDIARRAKDLEEFIGKSPKWAGVTTYRGMSLSPKEYDSLKNDLKNSKGSMKGSASWSTAQGTAEGFSRSHIGEISAEFGDKKTLRVVLITEAHEIATSIRHLSNFPGENEVLASKNCRYKYLREENKNGFIYVYVEPGI